MRKRGSGSNRLAYLAALVLCSGGVFLGGCSKKSSTSPSTDPGSGGGGGGGSIANGAGSALTDNEVNVKAVTTAYGGTCEEVTRTTTGCETSRSALGLTGNWLNFSCNVVLGLATSAGVSTTTYADAAYVTVTIPDLPDYLSNYYPSSGSFSFTANGSSISGTYASMYDNYSTTFPDPGSIASQSITMNIPISPSFVGSNKMSAGVVGVTVNGIAIYNNLANATDNIFAEAGSFDQCQGHPAGSMYHYHSEPYSISYEDNHLIGVLRDGYFLYGRNDYDGTTPGTTAKLETAGTSSDLYKFGGHTGADPIANTGTTFHYHLTEWEGCYHESGKTKSGDDGETNDTFNSGVTAACGGTWVDAWFMTGHGNGGAFMTVPSGLDAQTPSQAIAGIRYYYGTAGTCTGCN